MGGETGPGSGPLLMQAYHAGIQQSHFRPPKTTRMWLPLSPHLTSTRKYLNHTFSGPNCGLACKKLRFCASQNKRKHFFLPVLSWHSVSTDLGGGPTNLLGPASRQLLSTSSKRNANPTLMTPSNPNCPQRCISNTIMLGVRESTYEFWEDTCSS